MKKNSPIFKSTKYLTSAAMLTALSVIIGIFCKNFLNFGNGLYRITFENLPILAAGICLGPIAGGMVGCASDLISYLLSSQMYPPNPIVTIGAAAVGIMSGVMFSYLKSKMSMTKGIVLSCLSAHMVGSMLIKTVGLYQYYHIAVLWRIPLYFLIAPIEILILCKLFSRESLKRFIEK